ncbi:MAG: glucokinase [Pseudomonadota bacterium]
MAESVLVADIGATHARFAVAETQAGAIAIRNMQVLSADDFKTMRESAAAYLETALEKPDRACFAVAAPIIGNEIAFVNSSWRFRADEIRDAMGLRDLRVINDFYALAAGVVFLPEEAVIVVKAGEADPAAPRLVMGPGTGFGQALIAPLPAGEVIFPTEGGHVSFAPQATREFELMRVIARKHPRVSVERLLSGRGLENIYAGLRALDGEPDAAMPAEAITAAASAGDDRCAVETLDVFCSVLGRTAGDAVLATGARGGVTLGGGILPKIRDLFLASDFTKEFVSKGRMEAYMAPVPVALIIADGAALYGAAASIAR